MGSGAVQDHDGAATTNDWVVAKRMEDRGTPPGEPLKGVDLVLTKQTAGMKRVTSAPRRIHAVVSNHFELRFRDMEDDLLEEFVDMFGDLNRTGLVFVLQGVVFVRLIKIGDFVRIVIHVQNTGFGHCGSSRITDDIVHAGLHRIEVSLFGINVKAILVLGV